MFRRTPCKGLSCKLNRINIWTQYAEETRQNMTSLTSRGYGIPRHMLSDADIAALKSELTVTPNLGMPMPGVVPVQFRLWQESSKKLYVPKYYGLKEFGIPDSTDVPEGTRIDVSFKGSLRQEQLDPVNAIVKACNDPEKMGGIINLSCGAGKCLGKDTPVMMFDGGIKKVQDIIPGEFIMGDDGTRRRVISTCTGIDTLYKVTPASQTYNPYIVNEPHVLSLKHFLSGSILDIPLSEFLELPESIRVKWHGYAVTVDSKTKEMKETYEISISEQGQGEYFGFEIDGNRRFLLGDGTVTHNTVIGLYAISVIGLKAMIIVHKDFLLTQWKERIDQFLPDARVGLIKAKTVDVKDKDIVIASLQSLSMKDYDPSVFEGIGFVVIDEVHRTGTEVFSQALHKVNFKNSLGLSATVQRKDGMTKVFTWFIGDVVYKKKRKQDNVIASVRNFEDKAPEYNTEECMFNGKLNSSKMINNVCNYTPRTKYIADVASNAVKEGRKVLILSDRKAHLASIKTMLSTGVTSGFYIGGMKDAALKASEECSVILATFSFASEGFDAQGLDTLILASPKTDIEQSVGRILRQKESERKNVPLIIDIVDSFSIFERQGKKRTAYYKKLKYAIETRHVVNGMDVAQEGGVTDDDDEDDDADPGPLKMNKGCCLIDDDDE